MMNCASQYLLFLPLICEQNLLTVGQRLGFQRQMNRYMPAMNEIVGEAFLAYNFREGLS